MTTLRRLLVGLALLLTAACSSGGDRAHRAEPTPTRTPRAATDPARVRAAQPPLPARLPDPGDRMTTLRRLLVGLALLLTAA
ncbi:hypothetical protein ACFYSF_18835, partial [Streptomyces canus]